MRRCPWPCQREASFGPCVQVDGQYIVPYTVTIPGTELKFEMIPIPGGEFLMGSPDSEPGHQPTEGPQIRVKTRPFQDAED